MQAKTHITTTLALGLPLMSLTNELTLINVGVLAVGSLLPDIDHPSSYLGKRHKMVSGVTNKAFGHRGITHSLLGFILIGIIVKFIQKQYLTDRIEDIVFWLMLGYLLHLLEDSFSQRGVKWLYPFTKSGSSFGGKFFFASETLAWCFLAICQKYSIFFGSSANSLHCYLVCHFSLILCRHYLTY